MIEILTNTTRGVNILPLTETRRCPVSHVDLAITFVPHIKALSTAQIGEILHMTTDVAIKEMKPCEMGICRRNAPLISVAYSLLREGKAVMIKGRDIGANMVNLIGKLNSKSIAQLIDKAEAYRSKESEKLLAMGRKGENRLQALNDRIDTLIALCEGFDTIKQLIDRINSIFSDDTTAKRIILSTVHKAKGLEADTVYILDADKIMLPMTQDWTIQQEQNLAYVAYTRSKHTLVMVNDKK